MALLMKKAFFLDDVILMHTTCTLAAGDLSEEGGVRRRHGISGWPEAGRGRRGASSGREGSDYMVDTIFSRQLLQLQRHAKAVKPQRNRETDGRKHPLTRRPAEQARHEKTNTNSLTNVDTPPNGQLKQHNVMSLNRRKAPPEHWSINSPLSSWEAPGLESKRHEYLVCLDSLHAFSKTAGAFPGKLAQDREK